MFFKNWAYEYLGQDALRALPSQSPLSCAPTNQSVNCPASLLVIVIPINTEASPQASVYYMAQNNKHLPCKLLLSFLQVGKQLIRSRQFPFWFGQLCNCATGTEIRSGFLSSLEDLQRSLHTFHRLCCQPMSKSQKLAKINCINYIGKREPVQHAIC